ncbi:S8 family serine peptidase [Paraburkholderia sp. RL17-381-BIF-C]|uniref:S8 family serine peptidase n=1 Tax=Paraburkholderia sp. RL17-381-BIF-C TaxID=3031635 RepID=UPI0038BDEDB3
MRRIITSVANLTLALALAACSGNGASDTASRSAPSAPETAEVAAAASAASSSSVPLTMSLKMNTTGMTSESQTDRFIIKYRPGTAERGSSSAVQTKLDKLASTLPARAHHLRRMGIGADVVTTERKLSSAQAKAFMRAIAADPNVQYVEPDIAVSGGAVPNDPYFNDQWGLLSNLDPGQPYAGIRVANAWNTGTGAGVTIALVDNGVTSHSDLNANISPGGLDFTFLPGPSDGTNPGRTVENPNCQVTWHGTHVAGILSAVANNGLGVAGVAPSAKVLSVRALSACNIGTMSSVVEAMVWSAGGSVPGFSVNPHPAKVINASLGSAGQCSQAYQDAIDTVNSLGGTLVVAAMNDNEDASNTQPANCHGVIAVGNTQRDGLRGYLSNYGPTVDISAPGTDILSTYNDGSSALGSESYAAMTGTSMAAPMVSGVVALVRSVAPKPLSTAEMRTLITQHAQQFPKQPDHSMGSGILDAAATVAAAKAGEIPAAADFKCSQSMSAMLVTCTDLSTARGSASIKSWTWTLGSGNAVDVLSAQSVNPIYNYEYPGTYNITLTTTDSTGAVSRVTRPFTVAAPESTDLSFDVNLMIAAKSNVMKFFKLDVPAGASILRVALSNRSSLESGTMYLRAGSPTTVNAPCVRKFASGSGAQCIISRPAAGVYYVTLSPDTDLNDDVIFATYMQ